MAPINTALPQPAYIYVNDGFFDLEPTFDPEIREYKCYVPNDTTEVMIVAITADGTNVVKIKNNTCTYIGEPKKIALHELKTPIPIIMISGDKKVSVCQLFVNRLPAGAVTNYDTTIDFGDTTVQTEEARGGRSRFTIPEGLAGVKFCYDFITDQTGGPAIMTIKVNGAEVFADTFSDDYIGNGFDLFIGDRKYSGQFTNDTITF